MPSINFFGNFAGARQIPFFAQTFAVKTTFRKSKHANKAAKSSKTKVQPYRVSFFPHKCFLKTWPTQLGWKKIENPPQPKVRPYRVSFFPHMCFLENPGPPNWGGKISDIHLSQRFTQLGCPFSSIQITRVLIFFISSPFSLPLFQKLTQQGWDKIIKSFQPKDHPTRVSFFPRDMFFRSFSKHQTIPCRTARPDHSTPEGYLRQKRGMCCQADTQGLPQGAHKE